MMESYKKNELQIGHRCQMNYCLRHESSGECCPPLTSQYRKASFGALPAPVVPDFASIMMSSGDIRPALNRGTKGS